jgi:hypothetical protein
MSQHRVLVALLLGWLLWSHLPPDRWFVLGTYETEAECRDAKQYERLWAFRGQRYVCTAFSTELPSTTYRPRAPHPPRLDKEGRPELET